VNVVTLELPDGRVEPVPVRDDESVVEAADRAGIPVPYGCLTGACGTCTGRLIAGVAVETIDGDGNGTGNEHGRGNRDGDGEGDGDDVPIEHRRPPRALKSRHLGDGYVLTCIARPRSDCRIRVGAEIQAELVENPWR